ncbi:dTDP-4-dehydrorhamnose reductase [Edaphobacter albus]|uniref:dTDP-4-dehydrorhamnose reductase n=1 Tax=Edaphobacter sp. 4G125 TaxID=2763071 RepID=UPI0016475775|nr:dTDP-4-dehydrorhamnose reductase [Edaphobacter sp. 4G125]QNI37164.1 dTDP-4-dehydrorhamnose reductase [Edaphobacter sp. 4G125]
MSGRILLTGVTGQVGSELVRMLAHLGEIIAPGRVELDLANTASLRERIRAVRPRWIVNPAAYTAVDKAESEPELAYAINTKAVQAIGEEAREIGAGVIHFSTDYVFAGTGTAPYVETDTTGPVSVYGASKLAGEQELAATDAGYMIFRTSWVYGSTGKNFLRTILKAARERDRLRVVADQHGAPTWSRDLARMTARVIERVENQAAQKGWDKALREFSGIYHAAGTGETTWLGFAEEAIRRERKRDSEAKLAELDAISTAEYSTPAKRPANSRLNCEKLAERFGWKMMDWRDSLGEVMKEL